MLQKMYLNYQLLLSRYQNYIDTSTEPMPCQKPKTTGKVME